MAQSSLMTAGAPAAGVTAERSVARVPQPPARPAAFGSVAIVHDYLNQAGGAERVVLAMSDIWPDAPVYTSLYRPGSTFREFRVVDVRTSPLDRVPVDRRFRALLALYPAAFAALGPLDQDLVVSSSSGWAHAVRTGHETFHAVYCHTPARWLYDGSTYLRDGRARGALWPVLEAMRRWDREAARRPDLYIANGRLTRERIRRHYGISAPIVHPPVDVERFRATPRGERLLVVARLLPYKRVDAIVSAATRAGIGLDVVGEGPALDWLREIAGPTVHFHGRVSDRELRELIEGCRALCQAGVEDFGIGVVEAMAAGKPVIALGAGGALEILEDGVTGAFFSTPEPEDIIDAIARCDRIDSSPASIADAARRFSTSAFETNLLAALAEAAVEPRGEALGNGRAATPPAAIPPSPVTPTVMMEATAAPSMPVAPPPPPVPEAPEAPYPRPRPARGPAPSAIPPRPLMLGKGWFPAQLGGLDRYYRDLLEHLPEARGVVLGDDADAPGQVAAVSDHGKPLPLRLLAFWRAAQRLADDVDLVDVHFALYALAPLYVGRLRRKPVVLHFHGPWADENVLAGDGSALRRRARRMIERAAYRKAVSSVVLTSAFRQVLVERYGIRPWDIVVAPPGVDLGRFTPGSRADARRSLTLDERAFVAVAVRRLTPRMGLEVLLDAWAVAVDELPEHSRLLIAGDGPLGYRLQAAITERGLGASVRMLGRISDAELVELYRAADVAVVPSLGHEGFGLVVIEAAACGTPSIVSSVGGLPEAVGTLDPSLIVAPGDAGALGERLLRARHELPSPTRTREHAERFTWGAAAHRQRNLAEHAVARHARQEKRLKVVYLGHVAKLSGAEIALLRLLPHLDRVNPHVVLAEDGPLVGRLHMAGISTEVLPMSDTARDLRKGEVDGMLPFRVLGTTAAYILRLAAHLRHLQPDLVHTNSLKAGVYGSVAARLAGIPVVWHVRDRIATDYLPAPAVALVRAMCQHLATAVVANSRSTLDTVTPHGVTLVSHSVLPEVLTHMPKRSERLPGPLTFGLVGRLAPWKGQDLFVRAFAQAFGDGPERAVIVGGALFGEDDYARELERLIDELGLTERVELRGHREDVWAELRRFDVMAHASITPEPFGQVVLEARAAGLPVIAARAGGPAEMIEDNVNGLLYELGDCADMARAMQRMRDPALRARLGRAARQGLGPYSPRIVADELQRLYESVLARPPVRRR